MAGPSRLAEDAQDTRPVERLNVLADACDLDARVHPQKRHASPDDALHFLGLLALCSAIGCSTAGTVDVQREERPTALEPPEQLVASLADVVEVDTAPHQLDLGTGLQIVLEHDEAAAGLVDRHAEPVRVVFFAEPAKSLTAIDAEGDEQWVLFPALVRARAEQLRDHVDGGLTVDFQDDRSFRFR